MANLGKVSARETLKPRREPYWHMLRRGCYLGFRPSARGGPGNWIARAYDEDQRRYHLRALGDFHELPAAERFTEAKAKAEEFAMTVESGGHSTKKIETVKDACEDYAKANTEAKGRFARHVYSDPIARLKLAKLRRHHVQEWRQRLAETPAKGKGDLKLSPSSVGRHCAMLRAALARIIAPGAPNTEAAWQEALRRSKNDDQRRTLYLDRAQRQKLLEHLDKEAEPFVRALCLLPLRPGAVAALTVADFDKRTRELTIGKDKDGKSRRILLPAGAAAHLAEQTKNKLPAAWLFSRAAGDAWTRDSWKAPIRQAVAAAKLPSDATAYTLRHSTITDLVAAGLPLLTIAQVSGTSAEMIERHYGHLNAKAAAKALAGLAL